jgi:Ca2+-binding RTX toxin-like protein
LVDGTKWGGGLGTGVTLTYSFPTGFAYYVSGYGGGFYSEWDYWSELSAGERSAVRSALGAWSDAANLRFVEVADNASTVGELRFAYSEYLAPGEVAHAYYPFNSPEAGDVWFNPYEFNPSRSPTISAGSFEYFAMLHEIGHALGLKHSFEYPAIPASRDNFFYTVMSYTASPWTDDMVATFYPTTPMYYDLLAIQALYGKDTSINSGSTTYTFNDGSYYWEAVNDASGYDRFIYNGTEDSTIDLNPGAFSSVSETIFFSNGYASRSTVTIGPGVVIESARGGSGDDRIIGNGVANELTGGLGDDIISGNSGNDTLLGGEGADRLFGNNGNDTLKGGSGSDYMSGGDGSDRANYSSSTARVTVSLINPSLNSGEAAGDTFLSVENLTGTVYNDSLTGNSGVNAIYGGNGNDTIRGGRGNDVLTGGSGRDTFCFYDTLSSTNNVDRITDFSVFADTINLQDSIFQALTALGVLATYAFRANTTGLAADNSDRIIYEKDTGELYYDYNGKAAGGGVLFATLSHNLAMTNADFMVV